MLYVPHLLVAIYLCLCLFFFLCARASLLSSYPPFLFLLLERLSLFIDRFQKSCFLFILSTDRIMKQFLSVFPSQLLISCWAVAHFSAFQAYFHQTVFLTFWWCHFLVHFPAFFFFLLDLCLSFAFGLGSRLWTWLILLSYFFFFFFFFFVVLAKMPTLHDHAFLNLCHC